MQRGKLKVWKMNVAEVTVLGSKIAQAGEGL